MKIPLTVVVSLLTGLLSPCLAAAQGTGGITGVARDTSAAVLPGVTVEAASPVLIEKVRTPAPVLIAFFDKDRLDDYLRLASELRSAGIGVEVFPEPKKLGQQLAYADRRGFRVALIAGLGASLWTIASREHWSHTRSALLLGAGWLELLR